MLSCAIGAWVWMGSAWGSKNKPGIPVIVGFFVDKIIQINNDSYFTVNFMLFTHYF